MGIMKCLELFSGSAIISKEFARVGFQTTTLDIDSSFDPDICIDVLDMDIYDVYEDVRLGDWYDVVWASPPCQGFSVAQIGRNWYHNHVPKTDVARKGLEILEKTIEIIEAIGPKFFFIENPRGKMRKMSIMQNFKRDTVTYCQYGDVRMKPTDIWHNTNWIPKPICKNGDSCHVSAPRGSVTGSQGMSAKDSGKIPVLLAREIANYCKAELQRGTKRGLQWD